MCGARAGETFPRLLIPTDSQVDCYRPGVPSGAASINVMAVSTPKFWKSSVELRSVPVRPVPVNMVAGNDWGRGVRVWKECNSLVKYLNTCAERKSAGIVNGYGHQKGRFVLVDLNDADKLRAKTDHVIGIDGFISVAASDFSTSNYLERNSRDQLLARVFRGFVFGGQS